MSRYPKKPIQEPNSEAISFFSNSFNVSMVRSALIKLRCPYSIVDDLTHDVIIACINSNSFSDALHNSYATQYITTVARNLLHTKRLELQHYILQDYENS